MKSILGILVVFLAKIHNYILTLNDAHEQTFTDKQLHFLVIGILGMLMVAAIYPLFKALSENHVLLIVFIYVITVIIGLTFAIEIGQGMSGGGTMEFEDIVFGVVGFILMFVIFVVIRTIGMAVVNGIVRLFGINDRLK